MKISSNKFWLILFFLICAVGTFGQTDALVLTSGGYPTVNGHRPTTPVSNQTAAGTNLVANLNFGDVSPFAYGSRRIIITMPIRIKAATNYKLELQCAAAVSSGIKLSDIGFGIREKGDAVNMITIAGNFGANPATAQIVNGSPRFQATLADLLEKPTAILTGTPTIVNKSNGYISLDLIFVIVPQYFTPTDLFNPNITMRLTALDNANNLL